ncbi:MAG TPA: CobW family GTP-binding protein, partial [Thermodesulfobacteriota bacterium]|nr:CobW family GTP-binding protein [Thermodesulfobacteriota bacterium]
GFLGAGKTTLLRRILQWPGDLSRTAVLVNEFGRVGIDGELLQGFQTPVYELTNGCICCTMAGDLVKTVEEILQKFNPLHLFIEATGVADPLEIMLFLHGPVIEPRIKVPKVVTVLDGDLWEGREYFGPLFYNQIKGADLLLFNKVDLLPAENIPRYLDEVRELNPYCTVIPTEHCRIEPEVLWQELPTMVRREEFSLSTLTGGKGKAAEELGYVAFAFETEQPLRETCFRRFIQSMPAGLYRIKGYVLLDDRRFFINHVGKKTEWLPLDTRGPTTLAFVGWKIYEADIINQLKACHN